jgi:hypothetical protein
MGESLTLITMRDRDWFELQQRVTDRVDPVTLQMLFDEIVAQADARLRLLRQNLDVKQTTKKASEAFALRYRRAADQYAHVLAERDALVGQLVALSRYAVHTAACAQIVSREPCSCGLAALVAVPTLRRGFPRAV